MRLTIKVKCLSRMMPMTFGKGDWIDLRAAEDCSLKPGRYKAISLGVAMRLPDGFEAVVVPRSSTYKRTGMMLANSVGVIDNSYSGDGDVWRFLAYAPNGGCVNKGDRIAQFRIRPSQFATTWQKIKWLLCSGVRLERVATLGGEDRGGVGSTMGYKHQEHDKK